MACGMIAMKNAGVQVDEYDAFEIDKYAIKTATHNFPEIKEHGDVFTADFSEFCGYDFLIGGSPCTHWSIAQHADRREMIASGVGWELFSQYVRALKECKPKMFIYENNKSMSQDIRDSISKTFGFEPICINSALLSAQNRNRLYWAGIRQVDGTYKTANITQPEDKGIVLKDIINQAIPLANKSHAITATEYKGQSIQGFLGKARRTLVAEPIKVWVLPRENDGVQTNGQAFRVYDVNGKACGIKANAGGSGGKTGLYAVNASPSDKRVYTVINGQVEANGRMYPIRLEDGKYTIRKLTVSECKRLQTVPEWYDFSCVSNTQAYKMLGNGWTCDVITHIIKQCLEDYENVS